MLDIKIIARPGPDPDICRFIVDRPLLEGPPRDYTDREIAAGSSPLAALLLDLEGVAMVRLEGETVVVTRRGDRPWPKLGKLIGGALRTHLLSGQPAIEPGGDEALLAERVDHILRENINPSLAGHGGYVELERVEGDIVFVSLGGGCQGCAMSQMTLKQGIERQLKQLLPEVTKVVDVTEHDLGRNAYFK